ncbi:hypothetical protein ABZX40_31755 [Streptomyces sp. NPDC004610]|uniref:hypothetical protein n=1 Tax=unclassified Streptomyces TaxID=2593676 RepID=UPI0033B2BF53
MTARIPRRARGALSAVCAATVAFTALGVALPASARAAGCETLSATVRNAAGLNGGHVQATACIYSASADFNDAYFNYVQDHQADGVAARAYVTTPGFFYGPLATDDTSTSGGQVITWESTDSDVAWVRVWVCLGKTYPGESGARCASDITYA